MKDHPDYRALLDVLRGAAKAKGLAYRHLAKKLGVSEVTVKRIFSGHSCTLERLFQLCDGIGVSFLEIASLAREDEDVAHFFTKEQEELFASKPQYFAIFKELYRGRRSPEEIKEEWKMSSPVFHRILRAFEKLGLLEVLPENRTRMKTRGNLRMAHRGPLARRILRPQITAFLDHVDRVLEQDDVCMHSAEVELGAKHIEEFVEEIHALGRKYRAKAFRDTNLMPKAKLKPVRWLFVFAPYETDWKKLRF